MVTPETPTPQGQTAPQLQRSQWEDMRAHYLPRIQAAGFENFPDPDAPEFSKFLHNLNRKDPALARELADAVRTLSQGMVLPSEEAARKRAARARTKQFLFFRQTADGRLVLDKQKAPLYGMGSVLLVGGLLTVVYALPNIKPSNSLLTSKQSQTTAAQEAGTDPTDAEAGGTEVTEAAEISPESQAAVQQAQDLERAQQAAAAQEAQATPEAAGGTAQAVTPITSASAPPISLESSSNPDVYVPSPSTSRSSMYDSPPPPPMQAYAVTPEPRPITSTPAAVPVQRPTYTPVSPGNTVAVPAAQPFGGTALPSKGTVTRTPAQTQAARAQTTSTAASRAPATGGKQPSTSPSPTKVTPARIPALPGTPASGPDTGAPAAQTPGQGEAGSFAAGQAASTGTPMPGEGIPFGGFGGDVNAAAAAAPTSNPAQRTQAFTGGLVYERTPKPAPRPAPAATPAAPATAPAPGNTTAGTLPAETPFGSAVTNPASKIGATGPFKELQRVNGTLVTAIYALTGGSVPVLVVTADGGSFVGVGTINGQLGRVDMSFRRYVAPTGQVHDIDALAFTQDGQNLTQGIPAAIEAAAPTLALDVAQNSASALQQYLMQSLNAQGGSTVVNGGTNTISPNALPPLWQILAGGAGSTFQMPKTTQSVVRIAKVNSATKMTLIVGLTGVPQ